MTLLLGMSWDVPSRPALQLTPAALQDELLDTTWGWGMAWYPDDGAAAAVVKDPASDADVSINRALADWPRFVSSIFVGHLRGAARRRTLQDTQPFARSWAGRDWLLTHNGDLRHGFRELLPLAGGSALEPVGHTDSEHVFCHLMERLQEAGLRRLADVDPERLAGWCRALNRHGTLNLLLSDGTDLVAYSCAFGYRPLHLCRIAPPGQGGVLRAPDVELSLDDHDADTRTVSLVASTPLLAPDGASPAWAAVAPGTLVVLRRGDVVARSGPCPPEWLVPPERSVGPAGVAPPGSFGDELLAGGAAGAGAEPDLRTREVVPLIVQPAVQPTVQQTVQQALFEAARAIAAPEIMRAGLARELGEDQVDEVASPRVLTTVHETVYRYTDPVLHSAHLLRLRPVDDLDQQVLDYRIEIHPRAPMRAYEDVFGNQTVEAVIREPYTELRIVATSRVLLRGHARQRLRTADRQQRIPLVWMPWQQQMMTPYLLPAELPESQLQELSDYAMGFVIRQDFDLVETLKDMNATIHRDYSYMPASTALHTTPWDVYVGRRGVCQDFANLFITLARLLNLPARYRVGYIYTGGGYAHAEQGDASHAWVEVYLPRIGWRGFDPTNGCTVGPDHVRVACGRHFLDATPTSGVLYRGGAGEQLSVRVRMTVEGG